LILTFDLGVKGTRFCFLFSFIWLLYGEVSSNIDQAVLDLLQIKKNTFDIDL